jgi:hypothetical protein
LRKAAIIAFGLSGIGGGSESIETWITPARVFAGATELCWAITNGAENKDRTSEPISLMEREVGFDMMLFFEQQETFACCRSSLTRERMFLRSVGQTAEAEDFLVFSIAPFEPPGQRFRLLLWYSALAVPTLLNRL